MGWDLDWDWGRGNKENTAHAKQKKVMDIITNQKKKGEKVQVEEKNAPIAHHLDQRSIPLSRLSLLTIPPCPCPPAPPPSVPPPPANGLRPCAPATLGP